MPSIEETQANLELPEQPPRPSDWNSADGRNVNTGIDYRKDAQPNLSEIERHTPAGSDSSVRVDGDALKTNTSVGGAREGKDGLSGIPNDAVTRDKKNAPGLADTTGKDYGYPQKNDPSEGIK
ncbi:hypothetical protein BDV96DRAFT_3502 [Lophiotrema nucula]|uniref:Uncharacterized protein n=1 Tax=Lophiotrema nucula TaxID=690887 RepID=A0A6A5ZUH6_9PLEO|nr:hypothetical protein BDV96DRAFT_3502 [Lophiotrema nucula]